MYIYTYLGADVVAYPDTKLIVNTKAGMLVEKLTIAPDAAYTFTQIKRRAFLQNTAAIWRKKDSSKFPGAFLNFEFSNFCFLAYLSSYVHFLAYLLQCFGYASAARN